MARQKEHFGKAGRRLALLIAGTGIFWILANLIGTEYGWSSRVRGLFDLVALAGFGVTFVIAIGLWRSR